MGVIPAKNKTQKFVLCNKNIMFVLHNKYMKFVDRTDETARLKNTLAREKSSLAVLYGRRRLGKSTLIKRVLSDTDVYFLADRSEAQHQRILLAKMIAQVFPDFDQLTYPDWEAYSVRSIIGQTDVLLYVWMNFRILWSNLPGCRHRKI